VEGEETTASPLPVELEAKLLVPTVADLRAIARLTRLGPYALRARGAGRLHSTYLDTAALTLARHGVTLRLRRQGRHWEATMKSGGRVDGDLHERTELTVALAGPPPSPFTTLPGPLQVQLAALVAGRPLTPILTSTIHRRRFDLCAPDAPAATEAVAELALDQVHLNGPQGGPPETTYYEVEVERRHGERGDVALAARWLRRGFNLLPSGESKFARGLGLLYGSGIIASADTGVLAYDTVEQGVRHILARHLYRLRRHDPGTRLGTDPEALHDMRVAVRRSRAAARIFKAGIPARLQGILKSELQWLGETLGQVRDLDVQLAKLDRFTAAAPAGFRPTLAELREYLNGERTRRRADMLVSLDTARYFRLLIQLERFASARPRRRTGDAAGQEPLAVAGRRAIKKAFRRLMKRGERTHATPHPEDLHALRIRAKRLRYLLEFLQELTGKAGRRLVKRLTALQDLLGSYHDAVVAADSVRVYVEGAGAQLPPARLMALGALVASELRLAETKRTDFERTWRRFARARTRDDCHAVLGTLGDTPVPGDDAVRDAGAIAPAAPNAADREGATLHTRPESGTTPASGDEPHD